ncbi:hypothetical protein ACTWQB_13605 [Piscibacillus sp. B03]|uniref:hypothetical protein n=1 Tax=Piscibacillus sp. B03 TaxID=3457430 RepID=UPI003FCDA6AA
MKDDKKPIFFHNRTPVIPQKEEKFQQPTSIRKPLSDEKLKSLIDKHKSTRYRYIRKLNLKQTLLTHLAYNQNFEESMKYNLFESTREEPIDIMLIDTSYSMKRHSKSLLDKIEQLSIDLVLYHDCDIFEYQSKKQDFPPFSGGTSLYRPIKRLEQINEPMTIYHLTDEECSPHDRMKTEELVRKMIVSGKGYYRVDIN